jgi:MFS transporter, DHA2 family, methylenomycin A resistance protein
MFVKQTCVRGRLHMRGVAQVLVRGSHTAVLSMGAVTRGRSTLARPLTLAAMSLGYAVVQLDVSIVNTALANIGASLGGGVTELQWVVSAYTIAFAALILTAGALGDRGGAKRTFLAGFAVFTAASLACALAPTAAMLIVARGVQGIGAAILVPNSLALLNHAYADADKRARAVAIWASGASLALTAGPLAGGSLIALFGWRSIFLVNLPIGFAGLWLAWRYAQETPPSSHRALDLPGQALAIFALGCLAASIIEGGARGWGDGWVVAGFGLAAALVGLFLLQERRARQPMLPLALFRERMFSLMSLVGLLVNVPFYGLIFVLSLYFQQINGFSPLVTGLAFVPMMGAVFLTNLAAAGATRRFGPLAVVSAGLAIVAAGTVALVGIGRGTSYWIIWPQLVAVGGGLGLLVPPLTSTLLGSVEKKVSGLAAGVLNSARQTGSVLGVALLGSLVAQANTFIPGAREALLISTPLLLGAAILTMVLGVRAVSSRR